MSGAQEKLVDWDGLSDDERDLFVNPHCHDERKAEARDGLRTPPDWTFLARTRAVMGKLTLEGKRQALTELNQATANLDRYGRSYPKTDVRTVRSELAIALAS